MQILSTKLSIPPLRPRMVARPRLIQKLNQGLDCGFVLISAPAGYGKSTLLCAWLKQVNLAAAWLSLDDGDNHPVRFLTYLIAALRKIDPLLGEDLEISLRAPALPDVETLLTPLVNELAQVPRPFYLALDDYHVIHNQLVHQVVSFLVEHRPSALHLAIATRADPPLPLARLRARSKVLEIRQSDLCFTVPEASEFLNRTVGLHISAEDVARILIRSEGWIASLQIAALSIQNSDDVAGFITSFTGSDYYVFDYLVKEILGQQSTEVRRFLLYTSILDQFCAPLCEAILDGDGQSAATRPSSDIIEELERSNLFVIPLDLAHRWFRYHHLFSDCLRLILEQTSPGVSLELHRRACHWYESQGMVPAALQHAISSGDMQLVAQIISANALVLVENDEVLPTLQKIDSLPPEQITALPWLGIARVFVVGEGQVQQSHRMLDEIEKNVKDMPDGIERQRLQGYIAAARAFVYNAQKDDISKIYTHAQLANELLPSNEIAVKAMNLGLWGRTLAVYERDPGAIPILEEALQLALNAQKPHVAMVVASDLATGHLFTGRLHDAQHVCQQALEYGEEYQRRYQQALPATASVYAILARVHAEWGEYELAIHLARKGLALSERWGRLNSQGICLLYLGRALVFANELEQARHIFQRAERLYQKISPHSWQEFAIFALESILDSEKPDRIEISRQRHRLEESGAYLPDWLTIRLLVKDEQADEALAALEIAQANLMGRSSYDDVRIYMWRAMAYQIKGDEKQALIALRQALELGEPENRVMTFVREGAAIEKLLILLQAKGMASPFVSRLLAAYASRRKQKPVPTLIADVLVEPLSARELEILKLLAQGYADKQIAETLVIARETVHKHLKNIYDKLDVHSRTEAIARAHELDLL